MKFKSIALASTFFALSAVGAQAACSTPNTTKMPTNALIITMKPQGGANNKRTFIGTRKDVIAEGGNITAKGVLYYNHKSDKMNYCDGSDWIAWEAVDMASGGSSTSTGSNFTELVASGSLSSGANQLVAIPTQHQNNAYKYILNVSANCSVKHAGNEGGAINIRTGYHYAKHNGGTNFRFSASEVTNERCVATRTGGGGDIKCTETAWSQSFSVTLTPQSPFNGTFAITGASSPSASTIKWDKNSWYSINTGNCTVSTGWQAFR